jgi:hypothetical protein
MVSRGVADSFQRGHRLTCHNNGSFTAWIVLKRAYVYYYPNDFHLNLNCTRVSTQMVWKGESAGGAQHVIRWCFYMEGSV